MNYVFTLGSVFNSVLPKTQNRLDKPVCFIHANILLSYVNETMSLLRNLPFFKIHVNHFMAQENTLSQCYLKMYVVPEEPQVILQRKKIKSVTVTTHTPSICHEVMGPNAMILVFWMLSFKPAFSFSSFNFIKRLFSSSLLSAIMWYHLDIWGCWYFRQPWFQLVIHPAQHFTWCTLHII